MSDHYKLSATVLSTREVVQVVQWLRWTQVLIRRATEGMGATDDRKHWADSVGLPGRHDEFIGMKKPKSLLTHRVSNEEEPKCWASLKGM